MVPDYRGARNEAFRILGTLDPALYPYHHRGHTFDDVLLAIKILAPKLGIYGEERRILDAGGELHDTGFVNKYWENEPNGVLIAKRILPKFGFSPGLMEAVNGIIMATHVPQAPLTLLQEAMCDADLYHLGTDKFWATGEALLRERMIHQAEIPVKFHPPRALKEWYRQQLEFLSGHQYFTKAARKLNDKGKKENIRKLEVLLRT